jgi:hypothetical protein
MGRSRAAYKGEELRGGAAGQQERHQVEVSRGRDSCDETDIT